MKYIIAVVLFCFFVILVKDNYHFVVTRYKINTCKNPDCSIKAVHISDIHNKKFGKNNNKLIKCVETLKPDYIFLTGDIISRSITDLGDYKLFIKGLLNISNVFYSLGNHEKDLEMINPHLYNQMINFLRTSGVKVLDNSFFDLNDKIRIYGITIPQSCYKVEGRFKNLHIVTENEITGLLGSSSNKYNILLAHNPFFFEAYKKWGSDLIMSGHVHGGIVRLPVMKGILSPERRFFPKYSGGIYTANTGSKTVTMEVSRGIGKLRLFNPPEIIFLDID